MIFTVAGGTITTAAKDMIPIAQSASIANGVAALMTEAAKAGIVNNEEIYESFP